MKKLIAGMVILTAFVTFVTVLMYYAVPRLKETVPVFNEYANVNVGNKNVSAEIEKIPVTLPIDTPASISTPSPVNTPSQVSTPVPINTPVPADTPAPIGTPIPSKEEAAALPDRKDNSIVNINQVYTYEIMTRDIKQLADTYPGLIEYKSLEKTRYNREIWAVKLGKGKPSVFINGSHHAREWSTTSISMIMLDRYANAYINNDNFEEYETRNILDKISIWFVPMVNPDGVTLQQEGIQAFPEEIRSALLAMNNGSSDFGSWKANAEGVDLNRQYPADWENIDNNSAGPSFQNFKGKQPLTSIEAKTLADFTYSIDPEITLSYHDSGRILYWHFHNKPEVLKRDSMLANEFSNLTGYAPVPPTPNPSGGGYKDWFIQEFGRPGFTAEIGQYANNRSIPVSMLPAEWERNKKIGLFIANEGYKLWLERNR